MDSGPAGGHDAFRECNGDDGARIAAPHGRAVGAMGDASPAGHAGDGALAPGGRRLGSRGTRAGWPRSLRRADAPAPWLAGESLEQAHRCGRPHGRVVVCPDRPARVWLQHAPSFVHRVLSALSGLGQSGQPGHRQRLRGRNAPLHRLPLSLRLRSPTVAERPRYGRPVGPGHGPPAVLSVRVLLGIHVRRVAVSPAHRHRLCRLRARSLGRVGWGRVSGRTDQANRTHHRALFGPAALAPASGRFLGRAAQRPEGLVMRAVRAACLPPVRRLPVAPVRHSTGIDPCGGRPTVQRDLSQALSDLLLRRPGFPSWYLAFMLGIALVFLAGVPVVYRRFGPAYALFAALAVLFPLASGLTSMERYVLIDFPVFAAVATIRPRVLVVGLMTLAFYALLAFMTLFIAGYTLI